MALQEESRLKLELELLEAMYPGQIQFDARSRDLKYSDGFANLQLRLPEMYPESTLPDVLSATGSSKQDLRNQVKASIQSLGLAEGEEALDAMIAGFQNVVAETISNGSQPGLAHPTNEDSVVNAAEANKTVIIWLHHLLALTKRKLALAPTAAVSGITKPGYPGIMVFSGPISAVNDHVNTLKAENWQAFQVRYDGNELWDFSHGEGVKEVETMAEVVEAVQTGEQGARRKQAFLEAVGIK